FRAEEGIRAGHVTGVQTCALPISSGRRCQLSAQVADEGDRCHRLAVLSEPFTVATAEAPMRKDSSGSSTLMRTGKRAASRIQSRSEERRVGKECRPQWRLSH